MRNFKKYLLTLCSVCMVFASTMALVACSCKPPVEEIVETHVHSYTSTIVKAPTCTEEGLKKYTCDCGDSYTQVMEMTPHNWGSYSVVEEPTCLDGLKERFCLDCNLRDTQIIASLGELGHLWEKTVKEPTCEEDGLITYTCAYCNSVYTEFGGEKLGHIWVNDACTRCGQEACRDLQFKLNKDGTAYTLVGVGNCRDKKVYVPSVHNGLPVEAIDRSFYGYDWIKRLEIIDNVKKIDRGTGSYCSALKEIVMADCVVEIGDYAFAYSSALEVVEFSALIETISKYAFYECDSLEEVSLPDSLRCLEEYAFAGSDRMDTVLIGYGIEYIGDYVFSDCDLVKNVTISDSVLEIGAYVFSNCNSLTEITIPDSVEIIGNYAFSGCDSLEWIVLGDSVQTIGEGAFSSNPKLERIDFPQNVKNVGSKAFSNNAELKIIALDDLAGWCGVSFADETANPLSNGTVDFIDPLNIESAGLYLEINGEEKLQKEITIPNVTAIGSYTFCNYYELTKVTISENVATIGEGAFVGCSKIREINYNAIESKVGANIFNRSGNSASVVFGSAVKVVPAKLFQADVPENSANITNVTFKSGSVCESIQEYAFAGCETLSSVVMSHSITSIAKGAFSGCKNLTNLTISDSVSKKVADLENPEVEVWTTDVHATAFQGCDSIATLQAHAHSLSYVNLAPVAKLTVSGGDVEAHVFEESQVISEVTLLDPVTSVGRWAFAKCYNLKKFNANNAKVLIQQSAFENAIGLTTAIMPNATIEATAFYRCTSLNNVAIGTGTEIVTVGESAFYCCSALTTLTIGANVAEMGKNAFKGTNLNSVDFFNREGWYVEVTGDEDYMRPMWSTLLAELDEAADQLNEYIEYRWFCTSI